MSVRTPDAIPPEDVAAERAVLGSVLLGGPSALTVARSLVGHADFTRELHRRIFAAMERLADRAEAIDYATVAGEVERTTSELPPRGELVSLMADVPTAAHIETYAGRVRYCATARRVLGAANEMARVGVSQYEDTEAGMMAHVQTILDGLLSGQVGASELITPQTMTNAYQDMLERRQRRDPEAIGIPTGYADLDRVVAYRPGELWYIAASPGVGKTTFLANLQDELAHQKVPSLFASVEQPAIQLMDRAVAAETMIDSWKIARGDLDAHDWAKIGGVLAQRYERPIYIYDDPSMTTARLAAMLQLAKVRHGVKVCFVDYVQILADESSESEYARVSAISRRLAQIARSVGVCVVAACQVSRKGAEQDGQIPRLAELRGSGGLEQDAFVVLAIGRKENDSTTNVSVRKNRNGQAGITVQLYFDPQHTKFLSVARGAA